MRSLSILGLALFVIGCGNSGESGSTAAKIPTGTNLPTKAPEVTIPAGYKNHETEKFSIAVPEKWQALDMRSGEFEKVMSSLTWEGDSGNQMKQQVMTMAQNEAIKMFAFEPTKDAFPTSMNINAVPAPINDLDQIMKMGLEQLKSIAPNATAKIQDNPRRIVMDATISMQGPQGALTYETRGHQIVHGGELYTITFSSTKARRTEMEKIGETSIKTLKFK